MPTPPDSRAVAAEADSTLALTHATVIEGGRALADQTILVHRDRTVRSPAGAGLPRPTRTIDLRGKYVIPGLVDSHIHTIPPVDQTAPLLPLTGVTAVREMWGTPEHHEVRRRISDGGLLGPHWVIAGPLVDGPPSIFAADTGKEVIEVADSRATAPTR
ncbi:amidohydrolase family protein [Streptomyces sp. NPDC001985]|uniref:amidohydrolase family protein n=1 Tax=Streptomyces sp. NPDC001985 TaxID=3154406 RepID=UPI00331811A4